MTEESQNPLVTFALFAYNQEGLVADAMRAALAQDYSPLEIIVSDDCSSDGTWGVITAIAQEYEGPHQLTVVRNESNLGIGAHVSAVGERARGDLIVVAAGDDVSVRDRVSRLVAAWIARGKPEGALHSAVRVLHKNGGSTVSKGAGSDPKQATIESFASNQFRGLFFGAAAAYTKGVFSRFPPISSAFEDVALTFRALMIGSVIYVDGVMVEYYYNDASVTRPLKVWDRARMRRWFDSLDQNIEGMRLDYEHYLESEGAVPDNFILRQLDSVKRKRRRARGLLSSNPVRFLVAMASYPYGVSLRAWIGFYRVFFGLR